MKKYLFFAAMVMSVCWSLSAQQPAKPKDKAAADKPQKVQIKPYGFVRNYLVLDSRKTVAVCGGDYVMIPYDEDWNITEAEEAAILASGATPDDKYTLRFDRNATPQTHFQALSSRFGLQLWGPQLMGANSSGKIEADFAGFGTTNTVLRLRLAYMQLDWHGEQTSHSLLAGQDWHPLSGNIMPEVLGMAAGAPFRPHSRTPQLRYELSHGLLRFMAAALYQFQYTSPGPDGESAKYAKQGLIPELFLGIGLRNEKFYAQLGADWTSLMLYDEVGLSPTVPMQLKTRCNSLSPTLYFQYTPGLFSLKMRTTLAENLGHLNMLSGYAMAVSPNDPTSIDYRPLRASVSYLDLAYGKRWRTNLLLGYHKNLGLTDGHSIGVSTSGGPAIYMKKGINNINSIYRIAPSISYNTQAFNIGLEYEWTAVTYGDLQPDGTVADNANLHKVANSRICLLMKYNF